MSVVIKSLEWEEPSRKTNGCWVARTVLGTYCVACEGGWWYAVMDEGFRHWEWEPPMDPRSYSGPQEFKDACQADFEQRAGTIFHLDPNSPAAFELEPLSKREIQTGLEKFRCPSCGAANVFLAHSVRNLDARRHVECRICQMKGPIRTDNVEAVAAWNELPRKTRDEVVAALQQYDEALMRREHGAVAAHRFVDQVRAILGKQ